MNAVLDAEKGAQPYMSFGLQLLRWALIVPACIVITVVVDVVVAWINSIAGDIPSGLVWLCAAGASGYMCSYSALYTAPKAQRATASTIALGAALGSAYFVGHAIREPASVILPLWYVVIIAVIFTIAAIIGAASPYDENDPLPQLFVPAVLRWILFLPCATIGALCIAMVLELAMLTFAPQLAEIAGIELRLLFGVIFIGIATAIAPIGRRIVVSVISLPWLLSGIALFVGGLFPHAVAGLLGRLGHKSFTFYADPFTQLLEALGMLGACSIPMIATFTLPRKAVP
jgi:hypothetical protein